MNPPPPVPEIESTRTIVYFPSLGPSFATGTPEEIFLRILREKVPKYFSSSLVSDFIALHTAQTTLYQDFTAERVRAYSEFRLHKEDGTGLDMTLSAAGKRTYKTIDQVLEQIRGVAISTRLYPYLPPAEDNSTLEIRFEPVSLALTLRGWRDEYFPEVRESEEQRAFQMVLAAYLKGEPVHQVQYQDILLEPAIDTAQFDLGIRVANPTQARVHEASRGLRKVVNVVNDRSGFCQSQLEEATKWVIRAMLSESLGKLAVLSPSLCYQKAGEIITAISSPAPELRQYLFGANSGEQPA